MQKLIFAGFVDLEPKLSDGGPFQDPNFTTPVPLGESMLSQGIIYLMVGNFCMVQIFCIFPRKLQGAKINTFICVKNLLVAMSFNW